MTLVFSTFFFQWCIEKWWGRDVPLSHSRIQRKEGGQCSLQHTHSARAFSVAEYSWVSTLIVRVLPGFPRSLRLWCTLSWGLYWLQAHPLETHVGSTSTRVVRREPWLFRSLQHLQWAANPHKQQMEKDLAWHAEQYNTLVFVAVLTAPYPFAGKDEKDSFPVRRNGIRLPYNSQDGMQPHESWPHLQLSAALHLWGKHQLPFSFLQHYYSLSHLIKRG